MSLSRDQRLRPSDAGNGREPDSLLLGSVVKLHVIPAKAGIQGVFVSKSFCGIERFWIPAFAGMTEIKLSHVSESYLTTLPRSTKVNEDGFLISHPVRRCITWACEPNGPHVSVGRFRQFAKRQWPRGQPTQRRGRGHGIRSWQKRGYGRGDWRGRRTGTGQHLQVWKYRQRRCFRHSPAPFNTDGKANLGLDVLRYCTRRRAREMTSKHPPYRRSTARWLWSALLTQALRPGPGSIRALDRRQSVLGNALSLLHLRLANNVTQRRYLQEITSR